MNIKKQISNMMNDYTTSEKVIANYFLDENEAVSGIELSEKLHISSSTISRFVRKVGYRNYEVFINEYEHEILYSKSNVLTDTYVIQQKMLEENSRLYDAEAVDNLISKFNDAKIVIAAIENTALACIDFAKRLNRYGVDIRVAKTKEEIIIESTLLNAGDVFIAVSVSGINNLIQKEVQQLNERDVFTFGISTSSKNLIEHCQDSCLIYLESESLLSQKFSYVYPLIILFDNIYIQYTKTVSVDEEEKRTEIVKQILENES